VGPEAGRWAGFANSSFGREGVPLGGILPDFGLRVDAGFSQDLHESCHKELP